MNTPAVTTSAQQLQMIEELQTLVNHMPDGILVLGPGGVVRHINALASRLLNIPRHLAQGRPLAELLDFDTAVEQVFHTGQGYVDRELIIDSPTLKLHVMDTAVPVKGDDGRVLSVINTFREIERVRRLAGRLSGHQARYTFDSIIGNSPALQTVISAARKAARGTANILLSGESGTGKEVLAQAIHNESARRDGPFIAINCAALPRDLIESELFGYAPGSFTGARREGRPGKFEAASGGTIFLDELSELPLDVQAKLLRVIQEREVVRLGDTRPIPIDVRLLSASNRNLMQMVSRQEFRVDLYYRCHVIELTLPPLRDRPDDIPVLAQHFLDYYAAALSLRVRGFSRAAIHTMQKHPWPGNVRELENAVERWVHFAEGDEIDDIGLHPTPIISHSLPAPSSEVVSHPGGQRLAEVEREAIEAGLKLARFNVTLAASNLGISKPTLYAKLKRYGIKLERHAVRSSSADAG
ncbi:sigma 54-interacting transcriptional regulator [Rhodoferax sp.]|uniref:sigma-54 interaction domain-containing protein n=1 Tax=Rhodoferax sp. TaxID=50421 RepID=UPI0026063B9C|nr:sigma 54-interacting transcriptional regulator [Rhodoferax sp.]MDD2925962.1 sigma 54-interacting transcriptional regulator [Rhodoferax sp.]